MMKLLKKINYRHYICAGITLGCIAILVFCFPYAFQRLIESLRDFGLSCAYYFCDIFLEENTIVVTVNDLSETPVVIPFDFPGTWEEFQVAWGKYWELFITGENAVDYLILISDILYYVSYGILCFLPVGIALFFLLRSQFRKPNNDYNKDSRPLRAWKKFSLKVKTPAVEWAKDFIAFVLESYWLKSWIWIFAFAFNLISIVIEFFAFYLYFVVSFDFLGVFVQLYKLVVDLFPMIDFVPLWIWCIVALVVFNVVRKNIGYRVLAFLENCNRAFIKILSIVCIICGTMGKKKTTVLTDIGLSQEVMFRDEAFKRILEQDLKFPNFPWINLENELKASFEHHQVYNLATVRRFVRKKRRRFLKNPCREKIFDYDYEFYGLTYDNSLYIEDVWDVLETYAQLYFVYIIKSSLLITNYSVSVSNVLSDIGNFPLWNTDFFKHDSRLIDSYYRHSHIIDHDALRLGKIILERNPLANSFDFGCILITEIGKERGNALDMQEKKKKDEGTNQKNDLFNSWLKMIRHSGTIDFFPFVKVFTDDQRPESWGADARQLSQILHIEETEDKRLAMPGFALEELLYHLFFSKFQGDYYDYRYNRGDNCLFMYAFHNLVALFNRHYKRTYNTFGYSRVKIGVEDGRQDGVVKDYYYYLCDKKIYSKRFSTDCFADFFEYKNLQSAYGINDLPEYRTEKAGIDELERQHSYFVMDLLSGMLKKSDDEQSAA